MPIIVRLLCVMAASAWPLSLHAQVLIPDLSGFWQHGVPDFIYKDPPSGAGPIKRTGVPDSYGENNHYQGDYSNPMLQPWAADAVKKPPNATLRVYRNPLRRRPAGRAACRARSCTCARCNSCNSKIGLLYFTNSIINRVPSS